MTIEQLRMAVTVYLVENEARFPGTTEWLATDALYLWDVDAERLFVAILVPEWTAETVRNAHVRADGIYWKDERITRAACLLITGDIDADAQENLQPEVYSENHWLWSVADDGTVREW